MDNYEHYLYRNAPGTLVQCLAREAVFGEDVMKKRTPFGSNKHPALPKYGLFIIKKTIFQACPQFPGSPEDFEQMWLKCIRAIEQACNRLRRK